MSPPLIPSLIDKQDNFEIIRDQIAAILKVESTGQQALAVTAAKDPDLWKLRVFTERSDPWEQWLNNQDDASPIINVWFDNMTPDPRASNVMERQKVDGVFNIDCYGLGISADIPAGGHIPGDQEAALESQRAFRLVRNILMAGPYTYLGLRGLVWTKMPQAGTSFQPQLDVRSAQRVLATRLALRVGFSEFAPQFEAEVLELISVQVRRTEDGEIVLEADFDFT